MEKHGRLWNPRKWQWEWWVDGRLAMSVNGFVVEDVGGIAKFERLLQRLG